MKKIAWIIAMLLISRSAVAADVQIFYPDGLEFAGLSALTTQSIQKDYTVASRVFDRSSTYADFESLIDKDTKVIVVMDNFIVNHLKTFFATHPKTKIRGIAAMGVNFKDVMDRNSNIAAVAYEIAGYLAIKGFKTSVSRKVEKIVGFYRSSISKIYAEEARDQLSREKIQLKLLDIEGVEDDGLAEFLKSSIRDEKPDAIWLMNDNKLINTKLISRFWLGLARKDGLPILCGIKKLSHELGICIYSETPTTAGIAQKITDIVYGYLVDENQPDFYGVEYIQETERTLNQKLMDKSGIKATDPEVSVYTGPIAE